MFVFCLLTCSLGAAQKGCGLWPLFLEVEPEIGSKGSKKGKVAPSWLWVARRLLLASREPSPPTAPFPPWSFLYYWQTQRPFGRPRGLSADSGPLQFPWAQILLLRPMPLPKWAKDPVAEGIIGDAWAGQMSTSDKTSTLNSLERISESGRKTSAPTSHCSLAITSFWVLLNSPSNHTEPHSGNHVERKS